MAIVSKTNRDGVDVVIESLQQKFYASLLAYWDAGSTYQMYPRANKNYRGEDIIPEVSLDEKDYSEVLSTDNYSVTSFFLNNDNRVFQDEYKRIKQSISIIFQADLFALYGETERMDEQFNMDVLRVLKKENFYIYGDIEIVEGVDNVYSDIRLSGELKERVNVTDISKQHVLKLTFDVVYKPNCNATLPPVCAGVSFSLNGTFQEIFPSGSSFPLTLVDTNGDPQGTYTSSTQTIVVPAAGGSVSIDIAVNGTPFYSGVSTNQDLPVKKSDAATNVGSKIGANWIIGDTSETFNGAAITGVKAAGYKDISVVDSAYNQIGSKTADTENELEITIADATQTMNSVAITSQLPETAKSFTIEYANGDPVVVSTVTDTATVFVGAVPDVVVPLNVSTPFKTGQTTSYVANDDGALERGNGVDFLTLSHNNYFGNSNRFTDELGGQTFANGWIIDWSTYNQITGDFIMWNNTYEAAATWVNAMAGQPYTRGSHTDWYIPNEAELYNVLNRDVSPSTNYAPFSVNVTTGNNGLWTSTTIPNNTVAAYYFAGSAGNNTITGSAKTANQRFILMRYGNISEL